MAILLDTSSMAKNLHSRLCLSNAVANVFAGDQLYQQPPVTNAVNIDFSNMSQDQFQTLMQQIQSHVRPPEPVVPPPRASITESGHMAAQSTSGTVSIPFPSSSLHFEHNCLTFQHQCLSSLYNSLPAGSWIIDSGATTHVCFDLALFSNLLPVSAVTVSLPNGIREPISHTGIVHLSHDLVLHNVLHVPSFRFNLISVSSLLKDSNSSNHFYSNHCLIQESTQGLMIGRGTLIQNLYILQPSTSSNFCGSLLVDGALWHQRLGHPSFAKLQHFPDSPSSFPIVDLFNKTILPLPIHVALDHIIDAPPSDLLPALSHDSVPLPDASPHTHSSASHSNATPISLETVSRGTGQSRLLNVRPKRTARAPGYLSEYHCAQISSSSSEIPSTTVYPLSFCSFLLSP
ncbi:unnamed protein product [Microthlaspi erraticum]|uniref:Retrovirus-related Pol polyprotein from transposon TNT 1-94-like beta-barrel domain-containing protein n=1 Tax=Microthlaspi erraticum TaxID=1685480 RepID=A0A6D2JXA3_9BRAS|nr:unnamed protein product [Microthlaspi erraticum]